MIRIGIVGVGFMGMIHFQAAKRSEKVKVVAIASRDAKKRAGDWTGIKGNFGPPGQQEDLTGITAHETLEQLLADPNVDMVDICVPIAQHAETVIKALKAGKHVLVEKAIALTLDEADDMIGTSNETGKLLMVAHVLPFMGEFRFAAQALEQKKYGPVMAAHFRRHISPPAWSAEIGDAKKSGGPVVDLHVHDTHFVCLLFGTPKAVRTQGLVQNGVGQYVSTQYLMPGKPGTAPVVSATSGAISGGGRPFTHGFEIYCEKGTLFYEGGLPLTAYSAAGEEKPVLEATDPIDAFRDELDAAADGVKAGKSPKWLDPKKARDALQLCFAETESAATGKEVSIR